MSVTLNLFLYIYIGIIALYLLFSSFNFYHIFKFGLNKFTSYVATLIYIGGVIAVLFVSFFLIAKVDWSQEVTIFDYSTNYINSPYAK